MKQLSNSTLKNASLPQEIPKTLSRRRLMGQVVLGGAAALALTACGGGGGSDSSSDPKDLVAAFDRLKFGMTWAEAVAAVGWEPNESSQTWTHAGYYLGCGTVFKGGIEYLRWGVLSSATTDRVFRNFNTD